jgi:hypothetical protein
LGKTRTTPALPHYKLQYPASRSKDVTKFIDMVVASCVQPPSYHVDDDDELGTEDEEEDENESNEEDSQARNRRHRPVRSRHDPNYQEGDPFDSMSETSPSPSECDNKTESSQDVDGVLELDLYQIQVAEHMLTSITFGFLNNKVRHATPYTLSLSGFLYSSDETGKDEFRHDVKQALSTLTSSI